MPTEALECRALLSGDTLATATVVDLNDDQPDEITDEIGNEGHGNLDVDLYQVTLTAGGTFVVTSNEVSPRDQVQAVLDQIRGLNKSKSGKLLQAEEKVTKAITALDLAPAVKDSNHQIEVAFHEIRDTVHKLNEAVKEKELSADQAGNLSNTLAGAARNMAQNLHDHAATVGGLGKKLNKSEMKLIEADKYRADGKFKDAVDQYAEAAKKAHESADAVDLADPLQALNSLIVTIRLFDSSGNELAEVHGQGGINLNYSVLTSDTYYVGISGNDNFDYDPNEEESGEEGSTGCYEMEMELDMPPEITSLVQVLVDPDNGTWHISGTVEDEDPESCIINFGGILTGYSTSVNADGSFFFAIDLDKDEPNGEGMAVAVAVDSLGQESEPWEFAIIEDC